MAYHTTDREGVTRIDPPAREWPAILASVHEDGPADAPEVWLTHEETGWAISYYPSGLVALENETTREPVREMRGARPEQVAALWRLLANGQIEELLREGWVVES